MSVRLDHGEDTLDHVTPFIDVMMVLLIIFMWPRRSLPSTFRSTCRHRPPSRSCGRIGHSISPTSRASGYLKVALVGLEKTP